MTYRILLPAFFAVSIGMDGLAAEVMPIAKRHEGSRAIRLREKRIEGPLASLETRIKKMLAIQLAIHERTKELHNIIESAPGQKLRGKNLRVARVLADNQKSVIEAATKVIDLLNAQGAAVAFPEVFEQLRDDMRLVQRRLENGDVGAKTQALQIEIVETLRDITSALIKSR